MATTTDSYMIEMLSSLDDAGFKKAQAEMKKLGVEVSRTAKSGEVSMRQLEKTGSSLGDKLSAAYLKIGAAGLALKKTFDLGKNLEQAQARQAQTLRDSGRAAELASVDLKGLGNSIAAVTGKSKTETTNLVTSMTKFRNIGKEAFEPATRLAADLAALMGGDLAGAAQKVGKALNDPISSINELKDAGVTFTEEQQKQIKTLMAQNDLLGAQKIILDELAKAVGGQAANLAASASGSIETLFARVQDGVAAFAAYVMPTLSMIFEAVGSVVDLFGRLPAMFQGIIAVAAVAGMAIQGLLSPIALVLAGLTALTVVFRAISPASLDEITASANTAAAAVTAMKDAMTKSEQGNLLLAQLGRLKEGTEEYRKVAAKVLAMNPDLAKSGLDVASSYLDIAEKVRESNKAMEDAAKLKAFAAMEDLEKKLDDVAQRLAEARAKLEVAKNSGDADKRDRAQIEYEHALRVTQQTYEQYAASATQIGMKQGAIANRLSTEMSDGFGSAAFMMRIAFRGATDEVIKDLSRTVGVAGLIQNAMARLNPAKKTSPGTVTPTTTPGGGGSAPSYYDVEAERARLRIERETGLEKQISEIREAQRKKEAELEKARFKDRGDREELLAANREAAERKIAEARKAAEKKAYEDEKKLVDGVAGYWGDAMKIAQGDIIGGTQSVLGKVADATQSSFLNWVGFGITAVQGLFEIFGRNSESAVEKLEKRLELINTRIKRMGENADIQALVSGDESSAAINAELNVAKEAAAAIAAEFGLSGLGEEDIQQLREKLSGMSKEEMDRLRILTSSTLVSDPELDRMVQEELERMFGASASAVSAMGDKLFDKKWREKFFESSKELAEYLDQIEKLSVKSSLSDYQKQLKDLDHLVKTGKVSEESAQDARLAIYDNMLASLEELRKTEGDQPEILDAINQLEEERYTLIQDQNAAKKEGAELDKLSAYMAGSAGESLAVLLEKKAQLERDLEGGKIRENSLEHITAVQRINQGIISNLQGQGAGADVWFQYEQDIQKVLRAANGTAYAGMTGFGENVRIPEMNMLPQLGSWNQPQVVVQAGDTVTDQRININGMSAQMPANLQAMMPMFIDWINRYSNQNITKGSFK